MKVHTHIKDWKDTANSFFDKSMSLAVLIVLFAFIVSPRIEFRAYEMKKVEESVAIDLPDFKEEIKPPEITRPQNIVIIEDDTQMDDDEDIELVETISTTTIKADDIIAKPTINNADEVPSKFTVYEEPPVPIKTMAPEYPPMAKKMGIQGRVVLSIVVYKNGKVGDVEVLRSLEPSLDQAAIDAVKNWEFQPAKSGGNPVSVWATIPIDFSIEK